MVNKATLLGRLGKDPQVKNFSNDNAIAEFPLATTETYKDREGKWIEITDWHNVKLPFKWMAERAEKILRKGSLVYIEGKIKTRSYDDKDGNKRYITEIVAETFKPLDKRENSGGEGGGGGNYGSSNDSGPAQNNSNSGSSDFSDDLPF